MDRKGQKKMGRKGQNNKWEEKDRKIKGKKRIEK